MEGNNDVHAVKLKWETCWVQTGRRVRNVELVIPISIGTVALYLGKKVGLLASIEGSRFVRFGAHTTYGRLTSGFNLSPMQATEYNSHKWTLYLRGANFEDLSYVIKKVSAVGAASPSEVWVAGPGCAVSLSTTGTAAKKKSLVSLIKYEHYDSFFTIEKKGA
jgi:hypothetical protein